MQTAYAGSSTTTVGELMELDAVAACVIGGVSLRGGRGTVLGVLLGAMIMTALINGMTLMSLQPEHKFIARGAVLILAVWMDMRLGHGRVQAATPGAAHLLAWTVAKDELHKLNAPFTLERFTTGRLIDEAAAAAVAH